MAVHGVGTALPHNSCLLPIVFYNREGLCRRILCWRFSQPFGSIYILGQADVGRMTVVFIRPYIACDHYTIYIAIIAMASNPLIAARIHIQVSSPMHTSPLQGSGKSVQESHGFAGCPLCSTFQRYNRIIVHTHNKDFDYTR